MTNSTDYQQYVQYLKAILDGMREGIAENERYYKGKEEEDAQQFLMIVDDFMELFDKITK